jgi:integrase/recombinase XerC
MLRTTPADKLCGTTDVVEQLVRLQMGTACEVGTGGPPDIALIDITKFSMRAAFAAYALTHEPASIRRCSSTWNVLCDFPYTAGLIPANPMPFVGRPKAAKPLPGHSPSPR